MTAAQLIATSPKWERDPDVEARVAYVRLLPRRLTVREDVRPSGRSTSVLRPLMAEAARQATRETPSWLAACYALTPRVERVSAEAALLDLGRCTPAEALAAMGGLLERLRAHGRHAVAGIGPSMTLAQLAAFGSPFPSGREGGWEVRSPLMLIATAEAPTFLRGVPVTALATLYGHESVTPDIVERLQCYGLRTLGHLARLGEPALRRQFGKAGAFLAAVAAGRDERPLQTTAAPPRQHFRLRFSAGADVERMLTVLPRFARRVMAHLRLRRREGRSLRLRVRWESGRVGYAQISLRQPTADARILAQEVRRLLDTLLSPSSRDARDGAAIEELRLTVGDFTLAVPDQMTLWRTQSQRRVVVETVAETLARRHDHPLVLAADCVVPAAIFAEDRYRFAALATPGASARMSETARKRNGAGMRETGETPWRQVPLRLHWW